MKTAKTKKKVETTPASIPTSPNEHSSSYLKIKAYLEKNNAELDPDTRRCFDGFHLGEGTEVREINNQIIATNYHGVGQWDALYVDNNGKCSVGQSIFGGF